jgi:hypothetical protein
MTTKKTNTYISFELDWLEAKAEELKNYVDSTPLTELKDRIHWRETRTGQMPMLTASIEAQIKSLTQALKDYAQIIEVVDNLREKEASKAEARGGQNINGMMEDFA